jgi:surfeit locus 1 family protein
MNHTADSSSLRWQGDWRTTLFTIVLVPVLISLGFWQLQREAEKVSIAQTWEQRQQEAPVPLELLNGAVNELAYRKVTLRGEFLPQHDLLLDNRIYKGSYGFELLTPLRLAGNGQLVLVNRGWIAGDRGRRQMPELPTVSGVQILTGTIYVPPGKPYSLGAEEFTETGPQVLLTVDMAAIERFLGESLFPYTIRLDADSPATLTIDWPLLNSSPQKHRGYAVQWFSMALALVLLFLVRSTNIWSVLCGAGTTERE